MRISTFLSFIIFSVCSLTAQTYQQIEATEYDASQNRWLTTNGSSIIAQDENGELSVFSEGDATHGMEVMNGTLFAIYYTGANNFVKGFNLLTGEEVMNINFPSAGFLNGMGSDPTTNRLWVSDFGNQTIIELDVSDLDAPSQTTVVDDTGSTPNGVVYDQIDDRLIFVSWGNNAAIKEVSLTDYSVSTILNSGLGNIDGIDMSAAGEFFISSWSPEEIRRYDHDFSNPLTITGLTLNQPADISYANEINTLGVANSGNETLTLIEFETSAIDEIITSPFGLEIFPNPVSSLSRIEFSVASRASVSLFVRDIQGRIVLTLLDEDRLAGEQFVMLTGHDLKEGYYIIELNVDDTTDSIPFVIGR